MDVYSPFVEPLPVALTVRTDLNHADWNAALRDLPCAHVLQTWEWGEFKHATTGWQPMRLAFEQDGAVVAMAAIGARLVGPARVLYAPKGPALDYADNALAASILDYLQRMAKRQAAIWLKIDPDVIAGTGVPGEPDEETNPTGAALVAELQARGWHFSADQVQFRNTITVDLTQPEDALLAAMGQSTRRKIRTAQKEGVVVRAGSAADLDTVYRLYETTGARDGFLIRPRSYYEQAWRSFLQAGLAHLLLAEVEGRTVGAVILFHFGRTCWYFYGASANEAREKQPNYLLQWEAMRWAQARGYAVYDFWGAPDTFTEDDRMWGVYQFKRGFHGTVTRHIGAFDYAPIPLLYKAYTAIRR